MNIEGYLETNPELTRAVVGYLLTKDGKVILGLRKKVSFGLGDNLISGIGGKVGDVEGLEDESDEDALVRELQEEIGVTITNFRKVAELTFLFPNKPKWNQFVIAYIIDDWEGTPTETDVIEPKYFDLDKLPTSSMWDDNQYWVPQVLAGKDIRATFLYGDDNEKVVEMEVGEV